LTEKRPIPKKMNPDGTPVGRGRPRLDKVVTPKKIRLNPDGTPVKRGRPKLESTSSDYKKESRSRPKKNQGSSSSDESSSDDYYDEESVDESNHATNTLNFMASTKRKLDQTQQQLQPQPQQTQPPQIQSENGMISKKVKLTETPSEEIKEEKILKPVTNNQINTNIINSNANMDEKYKILYEELLESKKKKEEATKKVIEDLKNQNNDLKKKKSIFHKINPRLLFPLKKKSVP